MSEQVTMVLCSGRGSSCLGPPSCSYGSSSFFCGATTRKYFQRSLCRQQTCIFVLECQFNPSKILCLRDGVMKKEKSAMRRERRSDLTRTQRHTSSSPTRYWRNGDSDVSEDSNVWDSNAENIWRRRTYSKGFSPQSDKSSNTPPGWKQPRKEWDYDSEDKTSDSRWRWWQFAKDNDEYDNESDEEEEDEEDTASDFNFKSILQEQVFSSLRWGLPLMILVLPWLLGNPSILMIGLTAIPAVQKAVGPVVSQVWRAFLDFAGYPVPPKRRQKSPSSRRTGVEDRDGEMFGGWSSQVDYTQPRYARSRPSMDGNSMAQEDSYGEDVRYKKRDVPYQDLDVDSGKFSQDPRASRPVVTVGAVGSRVSDGGRAGEMRGWDELTVDRRRRRMSTQQRAGKPGRFVRKRAKKEKPLLIRLILALFPFLQDWGGWLSVLLFVPLLDSFWAVVPA